MTPDLPIPTPLATALAEKGYDTLTPVQEAVLAEETLGRDLLVSAQTGSGKTVAFGLAMGQAVLDGEDHLGALGSPRALIIAPTRELAQQVERELNWLYRAAGARLATCVGGMDPRSERRHLERGAHIVVGTPGRLRDHIERGALDLSEIKVAVLDEADEMLDFGFREDLEYILDASPSQRQTLLFSATVPRSIQDIARRYQRDSLRISAMGEKGQHADIDYKALAVAPSDRENAIINVLRFYDAERAIVFCSTRDAVNRLASRFANRGFAAVSLSGELTQKERMHALQALRDGRARVCIATDVAARGIDLPGLELVVHADLPNKADTLLHRSGRTGRAGQKGICALIVPHTRRGRAMRLLRDAKLQVEWTNAPSLEDVRAKDRERLMDDPALSAEIDETMAEEAKALIEKYGAERIAAAFLTKAQALLPTAEELLDVPAGGRKERELRPREDFGEGVWFRMTVGRNQRAEPRWLLPLICRLGHVTKREVGSIRIEEEETRFQIAAADADRFISSVQAAGGGERSILIVPDDGTPLPEVEHTDVAPPQRRERRDRRDGGERRERGERGDRGDRFERKPKGEWKDKGERAYRRDRDEGEARERKPRHDRKPHSDREGGFKRGDDREDRAPRQRLREKSKGKPQRPASPVDAGGEGERRDRPPRKPDGFKPRKHHASEGDKPWTGKPKSRSDGKPGGKPGAKPGAKSGKKGPPASMPDPRRPKGDRPRGAPLSKRPRKPRGGE